MLCRVDGIFACAGFAAGVVVDVVVEAVLPSMRASHGGPPRPWS